LLFAVLSENDLRIATTLQRLSTRFHQHGHTRNIHQHRVGEIPAKMLPSLAGPLRTYCPVEISK
jgi:hypothetical protein